MVAALVSFIGANSVNRIFWFLLQITMDQQAYRKQTSQLVKLEFNLINKINLEFASW